MSVDVHCRINNFKPQLFTLIYYPLEQPIKTYCGGSTIQYNTHGRVPMFFEIIQKLLEISTQTKSKTDHSFSLHPQTLEQKVIPF